MRILIIVGGFFPGTTFGGPATSIYNMCIALKGKAELFVVTLNHEMDSQREYKSIVKGWNDYGFARVKYLSDSEVTYQTLFNITNDVSPDILYTNNYFLASFTLPVLQISRKKKLPLLIAPRGELYSNAFNKKYKKIPYIIVTRLFMFSRRTYFLATTKDEQKQFLRYLTSDEKKVFVVPNLPTQFPDTSVKKEKNDQLRLIYVARVHESKNLMYAIQCLAMIDFPTCLDIYGSIEDGEYWQKCCELISELPAAVTVEYKGSVEHSVLGKLYEENDAMFLPTITENFGHSIAESLLCGTPVLISNQTPWNWINDKKCGYALDLSDKSKFVAALTELYNMRETEKGVMRKRCAAEARLFLNMEETVMAYIDMFNSIIADKEDIKENG